MKYKYILIFFILMLPLVLNAQTWTKLEGTSPFVNAIFVNDNSGKYFVASDSFPTDLQQDIILFPNFGVGLNGFRIGYDKTNNFSDEILKDFSIFDFFSYPDNKNIMLASVRQFNIGAVVISTDGGMTWDITDVRCPVPSQILKFAVSGNQTSMLFAAEVNTSKGLVFTTDTFNICETQEHFVINARDVKISPFDSNMVFIGGNKSLRHVYYSTDRGETWANDQSGLDGLRILCLLPSQWSAAVVYAGVDSLDYNKNSLGKGIYQSLDSGKTWHLVGAAGKRVFALAQHQTNRKYMAAACDSGSVFFSGSYGFEWEEFSSGLPKEASIRTIALTDWGGENSAVALAGTYGYGLYKSSNVVTEIQKNNTVQHIIEIAPQPFNDHLRIDYSLSDCLPFEIEITDIFGRNLYHAKVAEFNRIDYIEIVTNDFSPGVYFIIFNNGKFFQTKKIIKQ